jgi:hypothetical protein
MAHRKRSAGHGERGMINLGLLAVTSIFTVFVLMLMAGLAVATNSGQNNQNAADAAALAGADAFDAAGLSYFAPGFLNSADLRGKVTVNGSCPALVRSAASDYASKNRSTLSSCRMLEWGQVEVTTLRDVPVDGAGQARATARADWQLNLGSCTIDPSFTPPETGAGFTWMQCGSDRFDLKYAGSRYFLHPWGQIKDVIEPRLTQ